MFEARIDPIFRYNPELSQVTQERRRVPQSKLLGYIYTITVVVNFADQVGHSEIDRF
jgi:hypothetical protein